MRLAIVSLVLVAACSNAPASFDSGIPGRDVDNYDRWENCEGCVIGCTPAGDVRCVPYGDAGITGCDLCFAFCGRPGAALPATAECTGTEPFCDGVPATDVPSCYRDLAR